MRLAEVDLMRFACEFFFDRPRGDLEFFVSMRPSDDNRAVSESWTRMKDELGTSRQSSARPHPSTLRAWASDVNSVSKAKADAAAKQDETTK